VSDPVLQPFFQNSDIQLLKWHQFNFMSIAFSHVPETVDVEELVLKKHARFFDVGMNVTHFDLVLQHFESALNELGIAHETIQEAVNVLLPMRPVFQRGVEEAAARKRAALRLHYIFTATVAATVGAIALHWFMRHHHRRRL